MSSTPKEFNLFIKVAHAEGISYLVLLLIAMPLKYIWNMPEPTRIVGMAHGVLFVAYMLILAYLFFTSKVNFKTSVIAVLLSFVPFGTFYLSKFLPKS